MIVFIFGVIIMLVGMIDILVNKDKSKHKVARGKAIAIVGVALDFFLLIITYNVGIPQIYTMNGDTAENNFICIKGVWGAKVYYSLEPYADPAVDGIEYTEPIPIAGSVVVSAKSKILGSKWSELAVREIVVKNGKVIVVDKNSDIKALNADLSDKNRQYSAGDVLTGADFVVKATLDNGQVTPIYNFEITPDTISAGDNIIVISYGEAKCEIKIYGLEGNTTGSEGENSRLDGAASGNYETETGGNDITTEVSKIIDDIPDVSDMSEFSGSFESKKQENIYRFVPKVSGTYRFDFKSDNVNANYQFYVSKPDGEKIASGSYYSDSGKTAELESGQVYYLNVKQYSDMPKYTISIGTPQAVMDVAGNRIEHSLTYMDQKDRYMYTAQITGKYRLNFSIDDSTCTYRVKIYGMNKELIASENTNNDGKTVDLTAGITYQIVVEQMKGFTGYNIEICVPNEETQVVSNAINGSIWYKDQIDKYIYIAPETGKYRFDFGTNNVNNNYKFGLYDTADNSLLVSGRCLDDDGKNAYLEAGKKYLIQIQQSSGSEDYTINIGVPQPVKQVEGNSISGKITYTGQEDVYQYTAPVDGEYTFVFDISDVQCYYYVKVYSEKNELLMSADSSYKNKSVQLVPGQTYTINVIQSKGNFEYTINIE